MLPNESHLPEGLLPILRRRIWLLIVPFVVIGTGTAVLARRLPDRYEAKATLAVMPQQVPESIVKSTFARTMADRLPMISQRILSRAKLESIIQEHNLYAEERKTGLMQDIIEQMKKDITIQTLKADAFIVAYRSGSDQSALKVTDRLAALFKDENLLDRESTAEHTLQFLDAQLLEVKTQLQDMERKLQTYRERGPEKGPRQEAELTELMRDYKPLEGVYTTLLLRRMDAKIAANLEGQGFGEQLKVIDPPRLPQKPMEPNRRRIDMVGMSAGLGMGLLLVTLVEFRIGDGHGDVRRADRLREDMDLSQSIADMGPSFRPSWIRPAVLLGIGYALVGIVFAVPTTHAQAWRLAAWGVSAIGYAAHIAYQRFRLRSPPGAAALHVAFAVALGAFGLAVGATIHSLMIGSTARHTQLLLLSLGIWPVMTAVPAFLVALGSSVVLARTLGNTQSKL